MKYLLITFLISYSSVAFSCPSLVGTWVSSKDKSMSYNNQVAELDERQKDLLNQILGYTKITYTDKEKTHHALEPVEVTLDGKTHDFEFLEFVYPYRLISCTNELVVIEHKDETVGDITLYLNFENSNTYWISPEKIVSSSREYFVRISN